MSSAINKVRLDQFLTENNFADSREKAKALIMEGIVYVNGNKEIKPGVMIHSDSSVEVRGKKLAYVSRGGLKLEKALKVFSVVADGKVCIDVGASTGGFTDVLLQNGASKVYAVDVGYGQLAWKLRNNPKVVNLERTNARYLTPDMFPALFDLAVMDASFISIKLILPALFSIIKDSGEIICLIKPQFEAGRENVGKKGVVKDKAVHVDVIKSVIDFAESLGLYIAGLDYSPIKGPEGNIEYICYLRKISSDIVYSIDEIVDESHSTLEVH